MMLVQAPQTTILGTNDTDDVSTGSTNADFDPFPKVSMGFCNMPSQNIKMDASHG